MTDLTTTQREILAHQLSQLNPGQWRDLPPEDRSAWRAQAENLFKQLVDSGMRLGVRSSKRLEQALEDLVTRPAEPAYHIEGENE